MTIAAWMVLSPAWAQPIPLPEPAWEAPPPCDAGLRRRETARDQALILAVGPRTTSVAEGWARWFTRGRGLSSDAVRVALNPTAEAIEAHVRGTASQSQARGTLWVVVVGQGTPEGILAADAVRSAPIGIPSLIAWAEGRQRWTALIVDAGPAGQSGDGTKHAMVLDAGAADSTPALPGAEVPAFSAMALDVLAQPPRGLRGEDLIHRVQRRLNNMDGWEGSPPQPRWSGPSLKLVGTGCRTVAD